MEKQWFVLHTLTGQELKVKKSIDARVKLQEKTEYIGEVLYPTERVSEFKNGKKTNITRKLFPGYVSLSAGQWAGDPVTAPASPTRMAVRRAS